MRPAEKKETSVAQKMVFVGRLQTAEQGGSTPSPCFFYCSRTISGDQELQPSERRLLCSLRPQRPVNLKQREAMQRETEGV